MSMDPNDPRYSDTPNVDTHPLEGRRPGEPAGAAVNECDWTYVRMLGFYCETHRLSSQTNPPTHTDTPPVDAQPDGEPAGAAVKPEGEAAFEAVHTLRAALHDTPPVDAQPVEPLRFWTDKDVDALRAAISDAYYEARNNGRTMEQAADDATAAVLVLDAARAGDGLDVERLARAIYLTDTGHYPPGGSFDALTAGPRQKRLVYAGEVARTYAALAVEGSER